MSGYTHPNVYIVRYGEWRHGTGRAESAVVRVGHTRTRWNPRTGIIPTARVGVIPFPSGRRRVEKDARGNESDASERTKRGDCADDGQPRLMDSERKTHVMRRHHDRMMTSNAETFTADTRGRIRRMCPTPPERGRDRTAHDASASHHRIIKPFQSNHFVTTPQNQRCLKMTYIDTIRLANLTTACDDPEVVAYILSL